jgi:hypothetical protein
MHRKYTAQKHRADLQDELSLGKLDQIGCFLLQRITNHSVGATLEEDVLVLSHKTTTMLEGALQFPAIQLLVHY